MTEVSPFNFLASPERVGLLAEALRRIGLEIVGETDSSVSCRCDWLDDPVELVWARSWWPDDESQEDATISVVHRGAEIARCDARALLRQKHTRPLAVVIIDELAEACGRLTGKPYRHA